MEKKNSLFRKSSLERLNSPDQLNQYIRVANPSVWCILIGSLVLLAGICVWGIFGHLDTVITVPVVIKDGEAVVYVPDRIQEEIHLGMEIEISGKESRIDSGGSEPMQASHLEEYTRYVGAFQEKDWVYAYGVAQTDGLSNGVYEGKLLIERVKPMSFIWNE